MTKHPKTRAERLKLRVQKDKKQEVITNGKIRRQKNEVREKEAEDEVALVIDNL